jgi:hypothetical protein
MGHHLPQSNAKGESARSNQSYSESTPLGVRLFATFFYNGLDCEISTKVNARAFPGPIMQR